jgi:DNA-binding HxlR family transcriptional regulator
MPKTSASDSPGKLPACPVELTLSVIGGKWNVLILRDLLPGTKRFGELRRSLGGVSQKVLTDRLREMEARSLLRRHVYAEVPPRVEYSLTDLGRSLAPVLAAMQAWGDAHRAELEQSMKNAPASE